MAALSWVRILLAELCFGTLAIPFTPVCQCLSKATLKAVGPFYLVSMPGEVKLSDFVTQSLKVFKN